MNGVPHIGVHPVTALFEGLQGFGELLGGVVKCLTLGLVIVHHSIGLLEDGLQSSSC